MNININIYQYNIAIMSTTKSTRKSGGIYMKNILTRKVFIEFNMIGSNLKELLTNKLRNDLEGKCCKEGYIKKKSIKIIKYSSGVMQDNHIIYDISFECLVCHPVQGMKIKCKVKNITRAGIRAVYYKEDESPIILFITREHNYKKDNYANLKEEDIIVAKTIGIRYQLNDESIAIIAELQPQNKKKRKITIN